MYLPPADLSGGLEWVAGGVLIAGTVAQALGLFVHLSVGQEQRSAGTRLTD